MIELIELIMKLRAISLSLALRESALGRPGISLDNDPVASFVGTAAAAAGGRRGVGASGDGRRSGLGGVGAACDGAVMSGSAGAGTGAGCTGAGVAAVAERFRYSIERFGFTNPVLIDDAGQIIAGHGRVEAAKSRGMATVPCLRIEHMTELLAAFGERLAPDGRDRERFVAEFERMCHRGSARKCGRARFSWFGILRARQTHSPSASVRSQTASEDAAGAPVQQRVRHAGLGQ